MDKTGDYDPFNEPDMTAHGFRHDHFLPMYTSQRLRHISANLCEADMIFLGAIGNDEMVRPGRRRSIPLTPSIMMQILRQCSSPTLFLTMRKCCRIMHLCSTHILRERNIQSYRTLLRDNAPQHEPSPLLSHPVERMTLVESRVLDRYIAMNAVREKRRAEMRGYGLYITGFKEEELWQWMQPQARLKDSISRFQSRPLMMTDDSKTCRTTFDVLGIDGRDLVLRYSPRTTAVILHAWDPSYTGSIRPIRLAELGGRDLAELRERAKSTSNTATPFRPPAYSESSNSGGEKASPDLLEEMAQCLVSKIFASWSTTRWSRQSKYIVDGDRRHEKIWYERVA